MNIQYTTIISSLNKAVSLENNDKENIITRVTGELIILDIDTNTKLNSFFNIYLDISNLANFIEIEQINKDTIISWLESNNKFIAEKENLYKRLEIIFNPELNVQVNELEWVKDELRLHEQSKIEEQIQLLNFKLENIKRINGTTD